MKARKPGAAAEEAGEIRLPGRVHQSCFGCAVGAVLAVLAGLIFSNPFLGQSLIDASYELPLVYRSPRPPPAVILVRMDERSRQELHQSGRKPWDRSLHARLLDRLRADDARVVAFDVLFRKDEADPPADQRLAAALRAHGRVVLGSHLMRYSAGFAQGVSLEEPDSLFVTNAAAVGVIEVLEGADSTVRQFCPRFTRQDGVSYTTLDWESARLAGAPVTKTLSPPDRAWWLNYYGPPGQTIPVESYYRALDTNELRAGYFRNAVVVVSEFYEVNLPGMRNDTFRSPFPSAQARFDGGEVHATILANLLRGDWLRRLPALAELAVLLGLGALSGYALPRLRPLTATAAAGAAMAALTALAFALAWRTRLWFPWMIPVAIQIPTALIWAILFHAMRSYEASHLLERSLALYLSPKQVKNILRRPELLQPGGLQQRISILSSDIANFSKISERMDAEDLVKLLNQYYEDAIGCIHATDGTVVNLIGDAIFAVWNAPQAQPDHQERACRAALQLRRRTLEFASRTDIPPLSTRLGLHTGTACVGNVGSSKHFAYTAIGEAVNLTFRLEGLNKQLGTRILATRDFLKGIGGQFSSRMVGHFRFKGFDGVVEVHELLGAVGETESFARWRESFALGLHSFQCKAFAEAERAFQETLGARPDDGPTKFYLERIRELRDLELPADWTGEIELKEK